MKMRKNIELIAILMAVLAACLFTACDGGAMEELWKDELTPPPAPVTCTVTFVSNGGTEVASQTIVKGTCAVKPQDPIFGTHLFEGWFLKGSSEKFNFSTPINQDITLYAHWDEEAVFLSKTLSNVAKNNGQEVSISASPANVTGQGGDSVTTISFPAGSFGDTEETVTEVINVIVYQTPVAAAKFTVSSESAVAGLDLTVTVNDVPVTTFNNQVVKVTTYIAKNLTNVGIHYGDETWTSTTDVTAAGQFSYESSTGKLVFGTTHFSQFLLSADEVAYVESNNTAYRDFGEAIESATNGDTVTLLKDYKYQTSPSYVYSQKPKYTIELNGHILDMNDSGYGLYILKNQTVTINDSVGSGELKNRQCVVYMKDGSNLIINGGHICGVDKDQATIYGYGNLTINGGVIDTAKNKGYDYYAVMIGNYSNNNTPANFVMTGGDVLGSLYVSGNDKDNNIINISGGAINNASSYIAGQNTTTITGGSFTGTTCFYFKAGTVNISGGTFTSIKGDGDWQHKDSACTNTGDAVIIEGCNYPAGDPTVNITGGTFKGYKEEGGTESTSGNIFFKNYGILVINYGGNTAIMSGTTVPYRNAVVPSNTAEGFVTTNGYIHFTDENTTLVNSAN